MSACARCGVPLQLLRMLRATMRWGALRHQATAICRMFSLRSASRGAWNALTTFPRPHHRQSPLRSSDSSRRWQRRRISRFVHVQYSATRSLTLCRSSARGAGIVSGSSKMRRVSVTNGLTFSPPLIVFFSSNAASEGQAFQVQHVSQTSQHCGWSRCAHSASPQTRARPVSTLPSRLSAASILNPRQAASH